VEHFHYVLSRGAARDSRRLLLLVPKMNAKRVFFITVARPSVASESRAPTFGAKERPRMDAVITSGFPAGLALGQECTDMNETVDLNACATS
jgi:hypothetical protein